jgi:hypothetical protein
MRVRDVYLLNEQTLKDADTVVVDLTKNLKILYLTLRYTNTNGATSNTLARLNSMVTKLACIDASQVLHSLSMAEEQAKNFFDYKRLPYQALTQAAGGTVKEECVIDFRRMPGDKNFYLDTSRFQNPQLQLTHDFTISATAGFATGDGKLTIIARVIDSGAEANNGFVMAKELDSFSSASSGDHTTDLPLDFPLASILVLNPVDSKRPDETLSNFKLSQDTDAYIPVNASYADLLQSNINDYGHAEQFFTTLSGTSFTQKTDIYYDNSVLCGDTEAATGYVKAPTANSYTGADSATGIIGFTARGSAVHSSVIYRFGDGVDPADIFDPTGVGKFQLKLTNAATGATPKVVTVQQHS